MKLNRSTLLLGLILLVLGYYNRDSLFNLFSPPEKTKVVKSEVRYPTATRQLDSLPPPVTEPAEPANDGVLVTGKITVGAGESQQQGDLRDPEHEERVRARALARAQELQLVGNNTSKPETTSQDNK